MIKSLLTEYGLAWTFNRFVYSAKIKILTLIPAIDILFEKRVNVKRIDAFNIDVFAIKSFLNSLPANKKEEIIEIADKAINGIIRGFSSIELDYGNPINWHCSPLTRIGSSTDVKWYRIPDFDSERGDIKVVWEASRFTHFYYFTRAYLITGDKKYYEAFSQQLDQWLKSNIYPYGVNYKCGQECTLRMINVLMAYTVFHNCGVTAAGDKLNTIRLVEVCYKKVLSNFFYAYKCIKNNHTFSEICGLIIGAWCCQDEGKVRKGYSLLDKEIDKQFLPDGGFTQYSFNYQRFTLQIIECACKIGEKAGYSIKGNKRIKNSVLLMYQAQENNGDVPNYGSNDGALIFPVTVCGYRDFRPVLNTVFALTTGKRLYEPGEYDEELLWFCKRKDISIAKVERISSVYKNSGFYTLRHNEGFILICLQNFKSRPAHMDQLHIDLWHKGVNIFCDSGTYSYASELGTALSMTSGHNTVKLANADQMSKLGAFLICDWTKTINVRHDTVSFSGTMVSKNGYRHTRSIKCVKNGYFLSDEVIGNDEYCEFLFHTPCDVKITENGFELFDKDKLVCSALVDGNISITSKKTYRSLYYLKKEEINCIIIKNSMINKKSKTNVKIKLL